jgi:hypothetical protein
MKNFENILDGTWQEFEAWIKDTIGCSFRWRVRPADTRPNREMIVSLIRGDIKQNKWFSRRRMYLSRRNK